MDETLTATLHQAAIDRLDYLDTLINEADLRFRAAPAESEIARMTAAWRALLDRIRSVLQSGGTTTPDSLSDTAISTARAAACGPFSWGAANRLPFLPRVRYGRTILRPPESTEGHPVDLAFRDRTIPESS